MHKKTNSEPICICNHTAVASLYSAPKPRQGPSIPYVTVRYLVSVTHFSVQTTHKYLYFIFIFNVTTPHITMLSLLAPALLDFCTLSLPTCIFFPFLVLRF